MPPAPLHAYARKQNRALPPDPLEIAHLTQLASDTIETLPPSLTRSLSDLKELDAVLNTSLTLITSKLTRLLDLIEDPKAMPAQRLALLKEVADDAATFKLGGEDKIRVATGTCETIGLHAKQLDLITSLMTSLMPAHVMELIPASSTPNGYPHLFPSYGSATAASLYRPRSDFFPPPLAGPLAGGSTTGITRAAQANYSAAVNAVTRYQNEGPLPVVGNVANASRSRDRAQHTQPRRSAAAPATAPRARTISQSSQFVNNGGSLLGGPGMSDMLAHREESPPFIDEPVSVKKPRRQAEKPPAPMVATWDTANPNAPLEYDAGSNADSPLPSAGTTARTAKRPRSQPNAAAKEASVASPVGERPPSTSSGRRRVPKKLSPVPAAARPPSTGARRRTTLPDEAAVELAMQHEAALASAMEDAAATAVVPLPTEATATTMGEDIAVQPALAAVSAANPSPAVLGAEGEAVIPGATAPVDVAYEEPAGVTSQPPTSGGDRENEPIYCVCKRVSFGEMIGCDGDECPTEWFHLACVGLSEVPKGRWFCPDCTVQQQPKKRRVA